MRLGYFDIKQSLSIKRRQDRSEALQLPDETDPSTLLALGQREFKSGNTEIAILFISKARTRNNSYGIEIQSQIPRKKFPFSFVSITKFSIKKNSFHFRHLN